MKQFHVTESKKREILELYQTNKRIGQIAKCTGIERHAVTSVLIQAPWSGYDPKNSRRHKFRYDEHFFHEIDTEEKAYYFGFLAADGWLKYEKGNYCAVALELHSMDRHILVRFAEIFGEGGPRVIDRPGVNKSKLIFHSARMCQDLLDKGFTHNKTFELGDITGYVPVEFHRHFVRGVMDGDGCWTIQKYYLRAGFRGTLEFLSALRKIIPMQMTILGRGQWKTLRNGKHMEAVRLGEWLYANTDLFLTRKYEKFNSGRNRRRVRKTPNIGGSPEEGNPEG